MLDPEIQHPTDSFRLSDGTRHKAHSYCETREATNSGLWPSKEGVDDESGICSPPLWTTSPPTSPQHRKNHYRSLSPASRTQAIVRGQRELMEMVRNMPESSYELSLKDLVEHHHRVEARQENKTVEERNNLSVYKSEGGGGGSGRKVDKTGQVKRSGNIDRGGFYLKMGFPFSLGSKNKNKKKNKKKNESSANSNSKVSPRPAASDKEWWKKSPSASRESDSGASSINSGSMKSSGSSSTNSSSSSRRSNSRREKSGRRCWPFVRRPKILTPK